MIIHSGSFLLFIAAMALSVYCGWRLIAKTGHPGYLVVLLCFPVVNLAFILFMVFSEWPIETALKRYEHEYGTIPEPDPDEDASEPSSCLGCGAVLPPGVAACPKCGWSYKDASGKEAAGQNIQPLSPTPEADIYRNQRGF